MKPRTWDPARLDVARFAHEGAALDGRWPVATMDRLAAAVAAVLDDVDWDTSGETRRHGGESQPWLHLRARTRVLLTCPRCLQPLEHALQADRVIRFVADEAEAERLDAESDDDVLALPPRGLDLRTLVEDELILALPLVPRHADCMLPASATDAAPSAEPRPASPFAALAGLKGPGRPTRG